jgi:hypothetical protein
MNHVTAGKQQNKAVHHNGVRGIFYDVIRYNRFKIVYQMTCTLICKVQGSSLNQRTVYSGLNAS